MVLLSVSLTSEIYGTLTLSLLPVGDYITVQHVVSPYKTMAIVLADISLLRTCSETLNYRTWLRDILAITRYIDELFQMHSYKRITNYAMYTLHIGRDCENDKHLG